MEVKFSKQDMIRFGNYLLSKERKKHIPKEFQWQVNENEIQEYIKQFHDYEEINIITKLIEN